RSPTKACGLPSAAATKGASTTRSPRLGTPRSVSWPTSLIPRAHPASSTPPPRRSAHSTSSCRTRAARRPARSHRPPSTRIPKPLLSLHGGNAEAAAAGIPAGVVGDPSDFGAVVAFLCSEQARFVTGVAVNVDGGAYAGLQ